MYQNSKPVRLITFLAVTIAVLTLAAELSAREFLGLGTPPLSVKHPTIEYMFKPNQDIYRFGNHVFINQYGMRSENFPKTKVSPAELRIMVFGDSIVNGGNLTDQQELATTQLEVNLKEKLNKPVLVGNISAGSWGPDNWLAYAQEYGLFEADIIFLVISSHDYADNATFAELNPNTHPTTPPFSALGEAFTRYLPRYLPSFPAAKAHSVKHTTPNPLAVNHGLDALQTFLVLAKSTGAKVYVIQHWTEPELTVEKAEPGYYMIRDLCHKLDIPTYSTFSHYQQAMAKGSQLYYDYIHINQNGQAILEDMMLEITSDTQLH
ncbi:MAG: SGNH/GDSL hydrolase family protein [Anaerolineae bacterium]|nr:SGNH/GDSL hydrolase family protein [Anaerolineae bacterium]